MHLECVAIFCDSRSYIRTTVLVINNHDMSVGIITTNVFLHIWQFSCLLTRIVAIGMPQFTLKSQNDLNTYVSSLLNSGNRSSKLAVSATNPESSSPLVSENFFFFNWSSLSGFSRHTNLLMTEANDDMLTNLTPTKLIT